MPRGIAPPDCSGRMVVDTRLSLQLTTMKRKGEKGGRLRDSLLRTATVAGIYETTVERLTFGTRSVY